MTERLSHKRDCLYKDKITCSKTHLFVLEKADYTYKYAVIRQAGQPTHLPVICSIPGSLLRRIIKKKYVQANHFHCVLCLERSERNGYKYVPCRCVPSLICFLPYPPYILQSFLFPAIQRSGFLEACPNQYMLSSLSPLP